MPDSATVSDIIVLAMHMRPKLQLQHKMFQRQVYSDVKIPVNRCEVRDSTIHGYGVFATRVIEPDELVTLYPADLIKEHLDPKDKKKRLFALIKTGTTEWSNGLGAYTFEVDDITSIVGDPGKCEDAAWLGHMCNDGAWLGHMCNDGGREVNARFCLLGCFVAIISLRRIENDAEILVTYGSQYWQHREISN